MPAEITAKQNLWAVRFLEHQNRLLALARRSLNPVMHGRVSPEDVVQETIAAACGRIDFFENRPDVPVYFKLRTILLQRLASLERRHLQSRKRDAYLEREVAAAATESPAQLNWNMFADTMTGPFTGMVRRDRCLLLHRALDGLPEEDRRIIELRNFEGMSNQDCAAALDITPKNASIRYVRALRKLQTKLTEYTEFQHG